MSVLVDQFENIVYSYLDTGESLKVAHWALMETIGAMSGYKKFHVHTALGTLPSLTGALGNTTLGEAMNKAIQCAMDPNIEGIPLSSTEVSVVRNVAVSENCYIIPASADKGTQKAGSRQYIADNAVATPREWSVEGFLTTLTTSLDTGVVIKPTLLAQELYLDTCAKSRRPVWFKTPNNLFHRVLIKQLVFRQKPEATNAVYVSAVLKEYVVFEADIQTITTTSGEQQ